MDAMLFSKGYTPLMFIIFIGVVVLALAFYFTLRRLDELVKTVERERASVDEKILVVKGLLDQLVGLHTTFRGLLLGSPGPSPSPSPTPEPWKVDDLPDERLDPGKARGKIKGLVDEDPAFQASFFDEEPAPAPRPEPRYEPRHEPEAGHKARHEDKHANGNNITDFIVHD